ncbi:MAG: MotA/TolQ/ExbB proton channel family protein [Lamprobacter sp.]|uniref:motility protein A n=1 Tax=Lamprobacter sp. TaxID=3100796 RepID=UPI002B256F7D|nr:MotA/TolQ/ExbB proton channel family protein [Lamprobacter sp.]MEA3640519.1 MotA/TolQ/ExbB proton channel family protein [Lamprobacter sp.]
MTRVNYLAAIVFGGLFVASFLLSSDVALFVNLVALTIVISGTLGATFLSYPASDILAAFYVARNSYTQRPPTEHEIIDSLLDVAVRSRHSGLLALEVIEEQMTISFLRSALGMLVDGYKPAEVRDILSTEMHYFRQRRVQQEKLFRHMARLAPAFGVAGSVVGLIGMVAGIGDPDVIVSTIPVALTSTLYGIVIGNFLLTPIAENISAKTEKELMLQMLIADGVMAILQEHNTIKLAKKLESFLTPAGRTEPARSLLEIRDRYRALRGEPTILDESQPMPVDLR